MFDRVTEPAFGASSSEGEDTSLVCFGPETQYLGWSYSRNDTTHPLPHTIMKETC
jgi:hypothetical protein